MASRKKKRKESYLWSTLMIICAVCTLLIAVLVVVTVFFQIKKDASHLDNQKQETTTAELVIETEAVYGWVETEEGTKFKEEDGTFAKNMWKVWEDGLYYLNDNENHGKGQSGVYRRMDLSIFRNRPFIGYSDKFWLPGKNQRGRRNWKKEHGKRK